MTRGRRAGTRSSRDDCAAPAPPPGLVQFFFPLSDGSGLKLTIKKWLGPSGFDVSAQHGLPPDVRCGDHPRATGGSSGGEEWVDECVLKAGRILQRQAAAAARHG